MSKKYNIKPHKKELELSDEQWLKLLERDYPPLAEEVKLGYKTIMLAPIKCIKCESKDFKKVEMYGSEVGLEEYKLACKNCGHINGHWSYGNWII
jgi:hypothetical protein